MSKHERNFFGFGGPNGVGKSTFLSEVSAQYPEFEIVHSASALMEALGLEPGDYNSLRKLSMKVKDEAYFDLVADLARKQNGQSPILDTHFAIMTLGEIHVNTEEPWIQHVDALTLLTAPVDQVMARISKDVRDRKLFPEDAAELEQRSYYERFVAAAEQNFFHLAALHQKPGMVIENREDQLDAAVAAFYTAHIELLQTKRRVFKVL